MCAKCVIIKIIWQVIVFRNEKYLNLNFLSEIINLTSFSRTQKAKYYYSYNFGNIIADVIISQSKIKITKSTR